MHESRALEDFQLLKLHSNKTSDFWLFTIHVRLKGLGTDSHIEPGFCKLEMAIIRALVSIAL